jgi:hypothetical protein
VQVAISYNQKEKIEKSTGILTLLTCYTKVKNPVVIAAKSLLTTGSFFYFFLFLMRLVS